jgi:hypothetical protein
MASTYEIPLAAQSTTMTITLAGVTYNLAITWRDAPANGWFLDIYDAQSNPILTGLALVTGANLLEQFDYLNFGFALYVQSDGDPDLNPTYQTLGITSHLYAVY